MLEFSDLPYQFVSPKPNAFVIGLARVYNRMLAMPGKGHLLTGIDLSGLERFREAAAQPGARFVLMPNHPPHSDPYVVMEICRRAGIKPSFMTAYDVFARSRFDAWVMQHTGAFSVDREGSDRKSMKCAGEILATGSYPLAIFPEGNVYLHNDRVSAFSEGAAFIALRGQKELGTAAPVFAVPVSLKYTFVEDVRERVRGDLEAIAGQFGTKLDRTADITGEIRRISIIVLAHHLKSRGHAPPAGELDSDVLLTEAATRIIASLESAMALKPADPDDLVGRIRRIRASVHAIRIDPTREAEHPEAARWADEAILALRILGYFHGYAAENPTMDRIAETVARLREDVTSELHPPVGRRRVLAEITPPIDLRDHLEAFSAKARPAIEADTALCEQACQSGLDRLNASNHHPGAGMF